MCSRACDCAGGGTFLANDIIVDSVIKTQVVSSFFHVPRLWNILLS
jgi:hypothetical protein